MSTVELIERNALIIQFMQKQKPIPYALREDPPPKETYYNKALIECAEAAQSAPAIDAVPVVRCEKCRYRLKEEVIVDGIVGITCDLDGGTRCKDFFCAFGSSEVVQDGNP